MTMIKTAEREINDIRLAIHEETRDMTHEQRKERLRKIVEAAEKEFGFTRVACMGRNTDRARFTQ